MKFVKIKLYYSATQSSKSNIVSIQGVVSKVGGTDTVKLKYSQAVIFIFLIKKLFNLFYFK
jgi:hypothetical protein